MRFHLLIKLVKLDPAIAISVKPTNQQLNIILLEAIKMVVSFHHSF